jgi:hypothetical protein
MSASLLPHLVPPATEAIDVVSQISSNAGVMAKMISDLLDYTRTRLGAGMPVSPAKMDLGALCRELYNEFRSAHPHRQIDFQSEGESRGNWDSDRLRQAISNLIGNAIQHSPASTPVELKVSGEVAEVLVTVSNGGPPIPLGELAKIFDPLVRGSSLKQPTSNRSGSIGLGLYIARAIAESHGGSIVVTSSKEAGTAFTMRVPRETAVESRQPVLGEKHFQTM